jgi:MoaA/NifB/PqqE/SkfB family radical SAM enzyme
MITGDAAQKLLESRVDMVSVSFHHHDSKTLELIEGHPGIHEKATKAINHLVRKQVPVSALCTISRHNMKDLRKTVRYINSMGIGVSFCIPSTTSGTSFSLGGDCVNLTKEELRDVMLGIIAMKREGFNIINNMSYLRDVIRSLDGKSKYPCLGGGKIMYLDWDLNLYPCMSKGRPVKIGDADLSKVSKPCIECDIQCFREPSMVMVSRRMALLMLIKDFPYYLSSLVEGTKLLFK